MGNFFSAYLLKCIIQLSNFFLQVCAVHTCKTFNIWKIYFHQWSKYIKTKLGMIFHKFSPKRLHGLTFFWRLQYFKTILRYHIKCYWKSQKSTCCDLFNHFLLSVVWKEFTPHFLHNMLNFNFFFSTNSSEVCTSLFKKCIVFHGTFNLLNIKV